MPFKESTCHRLKACTKDTCGSSLPSVSRKPTKRVIECPEVCSGKLGGTAESYFVPYFRGGVFLRPERKKI